MSDFTYGILLGNLIMLVAMLGWRVCGPRKPRGPKPHVHDWQFTYLGNGVARYCRTCHEAKVSPYLGPHGNPVEVTHT